ncbi:hypothetical protein Bca52824_051384 [Brassica carinata]|uniref:Uncharacterized protein n=1 Tax=Brassica carinata TaxID=52824 RepID=A0A8X7R7V5_BRACI|nr:hypothetical protein Bca52824_051384 [Brassica carinata]
MTFLMKEHRGITLHKDMLEAAKSVTRGSVKVCRAIILTGWVSDEDKLDAPKQNACRSFVSLESWNQGLSMI